MTEQQPEPTRHVVAHVNAVGRGTLSVNGRDMTNEVYGFEVRSMARETPQVALHMLAGHAVDFDGDALVTVVQHDAGADPAAIATWLRGIDPAVLQGAVLARTDLGTEPHALTAAMLATLAEWASGRPTPDDQEV